LNDRRFRNLLIALLASLAVVGAAIAAMLLVPQYDRPLLLGLLVLSPGISVARWFPVKGHVALAVAGTVSAGWYLALFWVLFTLLPERRRVGRSLTIVHSLISLAIGSMATLAATVLYRFSPKAFGPLSVPVMGLDGLARILMPALSDPLSGWSRQASMLRYASGCIGYGAIAFLALYWFVWRKEERS